MPSPWELYAAHRARVTALLLEAAPAAGAGTLCLLGAGRCRDVDLEALARRYREIHLVDLSPAFLGEALGRQPAAVRPRLRMHAGVDLSGWGDRLAGWREAPPGDDVLAALADAAPAALAARLPPCDVVASTCLLSQMSFHLGETLGRDHPAEPRLREVLVTVHLRTLLALTRPSGTALLVNDVAVAPRGTFEARLLAGSPRALVDELIAARDHFRCSPRLVAARLAADPRLAGRLARAEALEPWLWTRTEEKTYLVHALRLERAAS